MFLISSAVTKAFHSDGVHARFIRIGETKSSPSAVIHFNESEHRTLINSLVETKNRLKEDTLAVEHLLRRVTGSITDYVNEVGDRPLRINAFDKTVLAIQDGNLDEFNDVFSHEPEQLGELLIHAAGRPGNVGKKMTMIILGGAANTIPQEAYLNACKNAIGTGDSDRVLVLADQAECCVNDLDKSLYGKLMSDALLNGKRHIAFNLLKQCTSEQVKHANPQLLLQTLWNKDINMAINLTAKGIDGNSCASEVIRILAVNRSEYSFEQLLHHGLIIENDNYSAMRSCIENNSLEAGKLLLKCGMNFDSYTEWCDANGIAENNGETFNALKEHWENEFETGQDESAGQTMNGM